MSLDTVSSRVAILADHLEEGWTSMDHYAAMLTEELGNSGRIRAELLRPKYHARLSNLAGVRARLSHTLDLYLNRYVDYPEWVSRLKGFELFHVVDQSYAHLASRLASDRTVVTCHDLDFAEPPQGTRHAWLVRATGKHALAGLRHAARVICDSSTIRDQLVQRDLVDRGRLAVVPLGVEPEFQPDGPKELSSEAESHLSSLGDRPALLHVGGMVARKRIDLLLRTLAAVRREITDVMLVRVGGAFSAPMAALATQLGLDRAILVMPFLSRDDLAALYRRVDLFLLTSETEGFGLPVLEAMASGTPVVARDLAAVREVAADAIRHVPGSDAEALAAEVIAVLRNSSTREALRARGLARAARFSWARTAELTERVYTDLLSRPR